MTLSLKLAVGVNPLRTALTSSFVQNSKCLSRFKHESSHDRPPRDFESQRSDTSSDRPNVKNTKWKYPSKRPSNHEDFKPTPKKKSYVPPEVVLFHNPASTYSLRAKKILEDAQFAFPTTKTKIGTPLPIRLSVHERLPTADEIQDAYLLLEGPSWTKFLTLHSSAFREHPTNATSILEIVQKYREDKLQDFKENGDSSSSTSPPKIQESADEEDPTDESLFDIEPVIHPPTHSLFGTECFSWPVILWDSKFAQIAPGWKAVTKRLYKYSRIRDGILSPEELQAAKEDAKERALQERIQAKLRAREVSPEEGDTLQWYNESSQRQSR